jgi:osmoprotectant transport system ATP-binding protein
VDSLLVTDKHEIAGIVWLSDLQNFKQYTSSLKDFISTDFVSVYEDTTLKKIVNTIDYNISGIIPVINHKKQLVGYLTKSILLSSLSKQYETTSVSNSRSGII